MDIFTMEIAGYAFSVSPLFESTRFYFRHYLTDRLPDFHLAVTREDLEQEQILLREEAHQEGLKPRQFPEPFLERAVIQRKAARELLRRNVLLLHGSVVAVDKLGYLFTANCGTGKSTHTRLWRQVFGDRAVMVNDDKPFLVIGPGQILVCGSPWSGKHGLDTNITVPLKGICILERGQENQIQPLCPAEAIPMLAKQSDLSPDHPLLTALAENIPLWHMQCTRDPQAAQVAYAAMSGGNTAEAWDSPTMSE